MLKGSYCKVVMAEKANKKPAGYCGLGWLEWTVC